jgi:hypothetical protein
MTSYSTSERKQLAATLSCSPRDLNKTLTAYTDAASEEYVRMILGQRVLTRGQDIREYRLCLMITHVFGGRLPSEQRISALFQTTSTQSRALLRAVMSKYQYELQDAIRGSLRDELHTAKQPDSGWIGDAVHGLPPPHREETSVTKTAPDYADFTNTKTVLTSENTQHIGIIRKSEYNGLCRRRHNPFHVVALGTAALEKVRRQVWQELRHLPDKDAARRFKGARWALLKNPGDLTDQQSATLRKLRRKGGELWRAYGVCVSLTSMPPPTEPACTCQPASVKLRFPRCGCTCGSAQS